MRSWYFFHTPSSSDQAIVGLMANAILHGHFSAFYWGQAYGGAEPYAVAGMFALFGHSAAVLNLTPALLSGCGSSGDLAGGAPTRADSPVGRHCRGARLGRS